MQAINPPSGMREAVIVAVRVAMARKNVSGRELAEQIGIPRSALSRRMTGETAFTIDELAAISVALHCTLVELVEAVDPAIAGAA
jgi:DNA-binding Xre family transcriptional regulator